MGPWVISFGSGLWRLLKGLPWQVYAGIALLVLLFLGWHWHQKQVKAADRAGYSRAMGEVKAAADKLARQAHELRLHAEGLQQSINSNVRMSYVQEAAAIDRRADALSLRVPPGLALRCPAGNPAVPGSAGRASPAAAAAAGPSDLSGMAVLPWQPLVGRGKECDLYRVQVMGWNSWYERQRVAYEVWRKAYTAAMTRHIK